MILLTYGCRPEELKIKPLIKKMKEYNIPFKTLFTGQHKDIANNNADYVFDMSYILNSSRLDSILASILKQTHIFDLDKEITHVLVQGDTSSALGIALSAFNHGKKIIHLEAGLRTNDLKNPFPEEANRQLISRIADIHLCPTRESAINLKNENITSNIFVVGNTSLDNLINYENKCTYDNIVLITLHRRENHHWMDQWFKKINEIAGKYKDYRFILPIHPNPNVIKHKELLTNVDVVDSLEHKDLLNILIKTKLVITDSGGIQEECSFFKKKCLVCRKTTERPEALNKSSFLVKNPDDLFFSFKKHIDLYKINYNSPFGDGHASKKITSIFKFYVYDKERNYGKN